MLYFFFGKRKFFIAASSSSSREIILKMGAELSKQVERQKDIDTQKKILCDLEEKNGCNFPGCDYHVQDRKNWMSELIPEKLHVNKIVWPGTQKQIQNLNFIGS